MSRYKNIERYPGIRVDTKSKKYQAVKRVNLKQYSKTFSSLRDAINWYRSFSPDVVKKTKIKEDQTVRYMFDLYQKFHFPLLEKSTQELLLKRYSIILTDEILSTEIEAITPLFIDSYLLNLKKSAPLKRQNFDFDLKKLKTFFNWYRENYNYNFVNPILKRHFAVGKIKDSYIKKKKLSMEEFYKFIDFLDDPFKNMAIIQFFTAGRIQEVAGLQLESISLSENKLTIKDVVVWSHKTKKFLYLKSCPKNKEIRTCHINSMMKKIFQKRYSEAVNSNYVFHKDGNPFDYRTIQYRYDKALKKAGIKHVSGTHFVRHTSATITRWLMGNIDYAMAMTGHKSIQQCEVYSAVDLGKQIEASLELEIAFKSRSEQKVSQK